MLCWIGRRPRKVFNCTSCRRRSPFIDLSKDVDGDTYLNGPRPTRYTLHLGTGTCVAEDNLAPDCPSDFPAVVPQLLGRKQRYAYMMRFVERKQKRQGGFAECACSASRTDQNLCNEACSLSEKPLGGCAECDVQSS